MLAVTLMIRPVRADDSSREYQIKAAFIYNFIQFVEWPADAFQSDNTPITIGVLGTNPFGDALERAVGGKTIGGRSLRVVYFARVEDLGVCQILFVNASDPALLQATHDRIKDKSVLSIGECDQFPWSGGVIRFYDDDNKVRFEVNLEAAELARLKISSKLLRLAKIFQK